MGQVKVIYLLLTSGYIPFPSLEAHHRHELQGQGQRGLWPSLGSTLLLQVVGSLRTGFS